jgi:mannan endo-1,4-beta-mannosidase
MAQKWDLKVIVVFANYFADLGGIPSYNQAFGGDRTTWWTDQTSQAAYRDHIKTLVDRYRYRCEIFAWELMNEPRCETPDNKGCDPNIITTWANDTSAWIKAPAPDGLADNNHMVSLGDEGWFHPNNLPPTDSDASYPYQGAQGIDTVAVLDINTIDFGTFHFYPIYCK